MRTYLGLLTNAVRSALRSKHDLMLEHLALRQQLAVPPVSALALERSQPTVSSGRGSPGIGPAGVPPW